MNLTQEQIEAINTIDNNLQIIACAGSGKTEVISRRIGNILQKKEEIKPENIVAFTFTEKAANSLKKRIGLVTNGVDISQMYIGTIHSFCYNILQAYCPEYKKFKILDTVKNYHFIKRYYKKCGMEYAELAPNPRNIKLFLNCIDKLVYDYENKNLWSSKDVTIFKEYKTILYEKKYFDFSLLIHETLKILKEKPQILNNIKYLIVDEYQDVDDLQEQIIECFAKHKCNICVVGDDDQTIYRFRGSNAHNMINFSKKYTEVKQIKLEQNFRCRKEIIDIAANVIKNNNDRLEKQMTSGKITAYNEKIKAKGFKNKEEEYNYIANEIIAINNKGTKYNEIAILVRKGKHIKDIAAALIKKSIPYISDSADYFFENKYFTLFKKTFEIISNLSKKELYDLWKDYCVKEKFNRGFMYIRSSIGNSNYLNLSDMLTQFVELIGFLDEPNDLELKNDILEGIKAILDDYEEIYIDYQLSAKIKGIIDFLDNAATEQYKYHNFKSSEEENGVQIMTIHKSKGLEFEAVILPNMDYKEFPSSNLGGKKYWHILSEHFKENKEKYEGDIDDERKLFYVALTRAKEYLLLTYDKPKISEFLIETSKSQHIDIDPNDLINKTGNSQEQNQNKEYWEQVKKAKDRLYDYYGTGGHFFHGMWGELERIKNMDPDEIIEEARKIHLI